MIQLHEPDVAVFDVRAASPQQMARTFATISNFRLIDCVLVTIPNQLSDDHIPEEVLRRVRLVELANHDENYHDLNDKILGGVQDNTKALQPASREAAVSDLPVPSSTVNLSGIHSRIPPIDQTDPAPSRVLADPGVMSEKFRTRTPDLRAMLRRLEVAARHNVTILLIG
ncbi:MAG: hypothetical protein ACK58L_14205, partial [Planctomycetota bacterium]